MKFLSRTQFAIILLLVLHLGGASSSQATTTNQLLVFYGTAPYPPSRGGGAGYVHPSTLDAVFAFQQIGASNNFLVTTNIDGSIFTDAGLAPFKVVAFVQTTGEVLTAPQRAAFQRFIEAGNGYVGVHSASDTGYTWPWYGQLVGAYFNGHPSIQVATVRVEDAAHLSTSTLPLAWARTDEWYNFLPNPRTNVAGIRVLTRLDESTYSGGAMGADHPTCWCHEYDGGRAWYTGGGHTSESYLEPLFRAHLLGGIQYAAGILVGPPPALKTPARLANGKFQFAFTNYSAVSFSVHASADATLTAPSWTNLGSPASPSPGIYQFTDPDTSTFAQRFYRISTP